MNNASGMHTSTKVFQLLAITVLVGVILFFAKSILAPLAIAGILAMLFVAPSNALERKRFPRWLTALLCVLVFLLVAAGLFFLLNWQLQSFSDNVDAMKQNLSSLLSRIQEWVDDRFGIDKEQQKAIAQEEMKASQQTSGLTTSFASGFMSMAVDTILVIVYSYLLLLYRGRIKEFILKVAKDSPTNKTVDIIDSSTKVAAHYVSGLAKMILVLWVLYGLGFSLIGVENAIFFAILCGLLELIPFVGNLTGTGITVLGVVAQGGKGDMILLVIAIYAAVQFVQTYLLEPLIVGNEVNINPLFTIISLVVAEAIWGIPGMVLAIPVIGVCKIICDRVDALKPYGFLIGTEQKRKRTIPFRKKRQ
ncbi:AI-2E family transporter [Sphingobacterium paludis]|uniref:Putative PurR-regulated permease PerM n=1 Tax=Sphingobacterium paludis TaxID=1476465 RepID=A0A4R7D4S7_9SPHI|nr:AI-2E family transporter [Sphingobacterium paludis]TDS16103.1 putative PurR-regulated permease PerM [Sphingobacterium paludis]